ncbi:MAG: 3-deoxy-manno-octulosonate cytidylyltransferase [Pseudobdellovibrionaceae bacterium]|nr:3-deoxy-manno-octulosonate cytidylyltransferase [Bdellovibrionales bacterium]USN47421.1 MAG: 3-deoxy-manno-octulosonate cytidylyltransferase [Pseudobdellovibrionaceae bacterium]
MRIVGVIPARYGATRFPGKPLVKIAEKPLLQWVIEGARQSKKLDEVIVATDHSEIQELCRGLSCEVVMTDPDLPSGSDRVWATVKDASCDVVVNIQGDEPLISGDWIDQLVTPFENDPALAMATLGRPLKPGDLESSTTAKIVINKKGEAIYFSRFPIPYSRNDAEHFPEGCLKHIGMYAFSKSFLKEFCGQPPTVIEQAEGLEQLRALYLGARIHVVPVNYESWGVDTPEDVKKIESILKGASYGS